MEIEVQLISNACEIKVRVLSRCDSDEKERRIRQERRERIGNNQVSIIDANFLLSRMKMKTVRAICRIPLTPGQAFEWSNK